MVNRMNHEQDLSLETELNKARKQIGSRNYARYPFSSEACKTRNGLKRQRQKRIMIKGIVELHQNIPE